MKIANFREYTAALREIYAGDTMHETGQYYFALMSSGKDLKQKKAELQNKIRLLNQDIQKQAAIIRETADKKTAGLEMQKIKKAKHQLVVLLKDLQNSDHFNILSEDAKTCVCSGFLLQKYLARELTENNPLNFPANNNGDLIVDTDTLRHSEIFQEAGHLKDFVAAYIAHNPEKVKTPGHFKTMLNGIGTWQELLNYAENFFETLNDNEFLEEGPIKASRRGTEVIMLFPEQNLQLVRLHTAQALDYESEKMQHCVGKGSYDQSVKSGQTHIYSLRDISEDGEWLPHVTIEYKNGKIRQVKAFKNEAVPAVYIPVVRQAVFHIIGSSDIAALNQENKISNLENWGYILDVNNKPHDIYNIQEELHLSSLNDDDKKLTQLPLHFLNLNEIKLTSSITGDTIDFLRRFKKITRIAAAPHLQIENPQTARELLFSFLGDASNETLRTRTNYTLLHKLGYVIDKDKQLHDLLNLREEIHLSRVRQNSDEFKFIPDGLVSAEEVVLGDITPDSFSHILQKFKNIKKLSIDEYISVKDPLTIRRILSQYLSDNNHNCSIHHHLNTRLGYQERWNPQETAIIEVKDMFINNDPQEPSMHDLVDTLNPGQTEHIRHIKTSSELFPLIDHRNLIFKTVKMNSAITPETITLLNRLNGIYHIDIEDADFSGLQELDLSKINFLPCPKDIKQLSSPWTSDCFFLENYIIPISVSDRAVRIQKSKNLPPLNKIKFPANVKHIMIDMNTENKQQPAALPDFRRYPELETLQLNYMDLSGSNTIYIPQNIKYLAFYNCRFGQEVNMDLSGYNQLKELRLNECDLRGVDNFTFPPSLKKLSTQKTLLKTGVRLPKIQTPPQQKISIMNNIHFIDAR